jgi:DNA polymerase-1
LTQSEVAYRLIHDPETLVHALDVLRNCTVIGIDTETTGLDPWTDRLRLVQLAAPGWPVLVIDLWQIPEDGRESLRRFLSQPAIVKIFHNAKFDLTFLQHAGLEVQGPLCDTMLASQLLDAGLHTRRHGLADVVQHFLHTALPKEEQGSDWNGDLTPAQLQYAATDAAILIPLRDVLLRDLMQASLEEAARLEWDCLPAVAEMELSGITVDQVHLTTLCQQLDVETTQAADALTALLHTPRPQRKPSSFLLRRRPSTSTALRRYSTPC